jgi:hypothetical protein
MKKSMEKKLTLGKIKIARLSQTEQAARKGGFRPTYTGCSLYKCPPPPEREN